MKDLNTIKEIVKQTMESDSKTRNNDIWLILQTMRKLGFKIYLEYEDIKNMPSFESITRSRRYWQNNKKILLPIEQVDNLRNKMQENYKEVFT